MLAARSVATFEDNDSLSCKFSAASVARGGSPQ
jgi:hypothetical protein